MSYKNLDFKLIIAPILATFFSMLGNGYLTTFISVRLYEMGSNEVAISLISSSYYIGIMIGAFKIEKFTLRVGHIRAFSTFASCHVVSTLFCALIQDSISWFIFRLITGISIAGIWIVIESWFLNISNTENRGKYLSIYMFALYGANCLGQLLLNFADQQFLEDFSVISLLTAFSIIPLAITSISAPKIDEPDAVKITTLIKINPTGILACFVAGLLLAITYSIMPYYFELLEVEKSSIALLMFTIIAAGTLLQFPIGYFSDLCSRRLVILILSIIVMFTSIAGLFLTKDSWFLFPVMFVFGAAIFAINPVGMSHVCDYIKNENIVSVTQGLVLVYAIGSIVGPLIGPLFMYLFGNHGIFIFCGIVALILCLFILFRIKINERIPDKYKQDFVATSRTTPVAAVLDPRTEE